MDPEAIDDSNFQIDDNFNTADSETDRTVKMTVLNGTPIATLTMSGVDMLCLAQISATILSKFTYNEIHNRRVALSIATRPCTASQMELLRCAGAVPPSSRRCGLITRHEAERLVRSFTEGTRPPNLPAGFAFEVAHQCGWGCRGRFFVEKYTSSRAKCIECLDCDEVLAPNKFIFHSHRPRDTGLQEPSFRPADAANFNSWRRHIFLTGSDEPDPNVAEAWEDVKALFNGGNRQNVNVLTTLVSSSVSNNSSSNNGNTATVGQTIATKRQRSPSSSSASASPNNKRSLLSNKTRTGDQPRHRPTPKRLSAAQKAFSEASTVRDNAEIASFGQVFPSTSPAVPFTGPALGANLWLVDTLFRSLLMPTPATTSMPPYGEQSTASIPGNANQLMEPPTMSSSDQLAAINLVKQKWPTQIVPTCSDMPSLPQLFPTILSRQVVAAREASSTNGAQFLIKNLVDMSNE